MKRSWMKTPEDLAAEKARIAENLRCLGKMAESGMGMTCGQCGHFDDISRFTATVVSGELPRNHFQCPAGCGWAVVRQQGKATVYPSGFVAPGEVALVPCAAVL